MSLRRLTISCIAMLLPLAAGAADALPADAAIRELGRAWLADNDGVGLVDRRVRRRPTAFLQLRRNAARRQQAADQGHHLRDRRDLEDDHRAAAGARRRRRPRGAQRRGGEIPRRALPESREQRREDPPGASRQHDLAARRQHSRHHAGARGAGRVAGARAHEGVRANTRARNSCASCIAWRRACRRAAILRIRTWRACCSASCSRRSTASQFEKILIARDRKAVAHGQRHAAQRQTTRAGIFEGGRGAAAVHRADELGVGGAALQRRRSAEVRLVAGGRARRVGEIRAPADVAHARPEAGRWLSTGSSGSRRRAGGCSIRAGPMDSRASAICTRTRGSRSCCCPTRPRTARRDPCARCPRISSGC